MTYDFSKAGPQQEGAAYEPLSHEDECELAERQQEHVDDLRAEAAAAEAAVKDKERRARVKYAYASIRCRVLNALAEYADLKEEDPHAEDSWGLRLVGLDDIVLQAVVDACRDHFGHEEFDAFLFRRLMPW